MTVRFPNGQAVQYNTAGYAVRSANGYTDLYTKKDGAWIAQVPNTCLIEVEAACRVYDGMDRTIDRDAELRKLGRKLDRALKSKEK